MTVEEILAFPPSLVAPNYYIYDYSNGIYKVVHFKNPRLLVRDLNTDRRRKGGESKLDSSVSRTKRVCLELALCNPWDWFCTFTLDKNKYDRYNLTKWYKDFSQWIRDQRKKTGCAIAYLLIPELHSDGAWHMHGFMKDVPSVVSFSDLRRDGWQVPDKLVSGDYSCWMDYHKKFGFCSLGALKNPVAAAFYITKYITKSQCEGIPVGAHTYYPSRGLVRASKHGEIYGECAYLDSFCTNKYEFCETGMTHLDDCLDWTFAMEYMRVLPLDLGSYDPGADCPDEDFTDMQISFAGV